MEQRYLLDTNAVLDFMGNKLSVNAHKRLSEIIDTEINFSIINKIELLGFSNVEQDIVDFVNYANILPLNDDVVEKTIDIRKMFRIKLPDAISACAGQYRPMPTGCLREPREWYEAGYLFAQLPNKSKAHRNQTRKQSKKLLPASAFSAGRCLIDKSQYKKLSASGL